MKQTPVNLKIFSEKYFTVKQTEPLQITLNTVYILFPKLFELRRQTRYYLKVYVVSVISLNQSDSFVILPFQKILYFFLRFIFKNSF